VSLNSIISLNCDCGTETTLVCSLSAVAQVCLEEAAQLGINILTHSMCLMKSDLTLICNDIVANSENKKKLKIKKLKIKLMEVFEFPIW